MPTQTMANHLHINFILKMFYLCFSILPIFIHHVHVYMVIDAYVKILPKCMVSGYFLIWKKGVFLIVFIIIICSKIGGGSEGKVYYSLLNVCCSVGC